MRKFTILSAVVLLLLTKTTAQSVGINNNSPHASAALDVTSTTKGVLIPRLTQVQRLAIAGPAKGLLVFDSTSNSFWYQNGNAWQELGATNAWKLAGNSGTDTAVNFLGTTDFVPLVLKVNNFKSGYIDYDPTKANTSFGYTTLFFNTTGARNTALGHAALYANTTGHSNTATGVGALNFNTIGNGNTADGYTALNFNATGNVNTATGLGALYSNTSGNANTADGVAALQNNTTGYSNVAIGSWALQNNTDHSNLVAVGDSALFNNGLGAASPPDATANTAVGSKALYTNTTGGYNTANGYQVLYSNTTGSANTANGDYSLYYNTTGSFNTANGDHTLSVNTTGSNNTANGAGALNISTGNLNTANGGYALSTNTTGGSNTALGYAADVSANNLSNATAIGANATVNASNKVRIGNSSVTVIEGQVDWSFPSDGRFKTNITETVKGLDFIMRLRPVVYNFQTKKYDEFIRGDMPNKAMFASQQDFSKSESIRHSGFVAQEVEQAAKETGYDFNGVIVPENDRQTYSLSYAQFVVPLVKAVQELSKKNDELEKRLAKLEALLAAQAK